jgi:hypothetical protein
LHLRFHHINGAMDRAVWSLVGPATADIDDIHTDLCVATARTEIPLLKQ